MEQQEQKTQAKLTAEMLRSLPTHPDYLPVLDIPIPLGYSVLIKKAPKSNIIKTLTDLTGKEQVIYRPETADNSQTTGEGIIYAVGPYCSEFLRNGLKCVYDVRADTTFEHKGVSYLKMDEAQVYFIMPDPSTTVDNGVKDPKIVRREKKIPKQQKIYDQIYKDEQNELDKKNEIKKKTIKKK